MKRRAASLLPSFSFTLCLIAVLMAGCQHPGKAVPENSLATKDSGKRYVLWEPQPAPNRGGDFDKVVQRGYPFDSDWARWSYALGNGTMGVNVFGRTDIERIQLSEKTVANGGCYNTGGITNAAELYLEFEHPSVVDYRRTLNLNEAIATVSYQSGGMGYRREYFTSHPDDVLVVRLTTDRPGGLSLTVRPEIPYLKSVNERDRKSGTVTASGETITLAGTIDFFNLNYEIQVRVLQQGGKLKTGSETIEIHKADSVTLLLALDTNYKLGSRVFLNEPSEKLDADLDPHARVSEKIEQAVALGFDQLKSRHLEDYRGLFDRVAIDLNTEVSELPTHQLLKEYKNGQRDPFLEELMFQYGRYLLIASSRENSLPAHLQGAWTQYEVTPWSGGYWHNINVQMNYWGAMNTDLPETFEAYINYFEAYLPQGKQYAQNYIRKVRPEEFSKNPEENGWTFGNGSNPYYLPARAPHSGPGTGGFTTKMLMEYYNFTQDEDYLREKAYPALVGMSRFYSKTLEPTEDGLLLINPSASPEIRHPFPGGDYYITIGSTFDQGFVWENHMDVLRAAEVLGITDPFLETVKAQIPRLDPIHIGSSGQIKEFREEDAYGDIGEAEHRHISHLCTLHPGSLINSSRPEWMEAASRTLDLRGNERTGWAMAHRMNARARLKEAEKAHDVYQKLIAEKTMENLWTFHPPFQIDANLGIVAGVAEMLLQSHEGAIEPIPALPQAWENGSFQGLVARGNFKISAQWEEAELRQLRVKSRSGKHCRLKYPGLSGGAVFDENGEQISFQSKGSDEISFPTQKAMTYSVLPKL